MALVEMSVVEQRYRAVLAVGRGEPKIVVAAQFGVSRQTLHTWLTRYARDGLAGLIDRTHRPPSCPHQAPAEVETRVCELRREHPRWGPRRIAHELARTAPEHRDGGVAQHGVSHPGPARSDRTPLATPQAQRLPALGTRRRRWRCGSSTSSAGCF